MMNRVRLRGPVDMLAAIPYLIGYQPNDSVVVLAMSGRRLYFSVRDDLPPPDAGEVADAVDSIRGMVVRPGVSGVLLTAFGSEDRSLPVLLGLHEAFDNAEIDVLELLRADGGRYWSYLCGDPGCCPPDGRPYDIHASPVPAEAVVAGCVALPDREAYLGLLEPETGPALAAVERATAAARDRLRALEPQGQVAVLVAGCVAIDEALQRQRTGGRLDADELAWLTVLLTVEAVQSMALSRVIEEPDDVTLHRALWMDVFRRAALFAAPGALFACASWRYGETPLARLALDRVLAAEPGSPVAVALHHLIVAGLPPSVLDDLSSLPVRRRRARRRRRRSSSRRAGNR